MNSRSYLSTVQYTPSTIINTEFFNLIPTILRQTKSTPHFYYYYYFLKEKEKDLTLLLISQSLLHFSISRFSVIHSGILFSQNCSSASLFFCIIQYTARISVKFSCFVFDIYQAFGNLLNFFKRNDLLVVRFRRR